MSSHACSALMSLVMLLRLKDHITHNPPLCIHFHLLQPVTSNQTLRSFLEFTFLDFSETPKERDKDQTKLKSPVRVYEASKQDTPSRSNQKPHQTFEVRPEFSKLHRDRALSVTVRHENRNKLSLKKRNDAHHFKEKPGINASLV